jgi:putative two-component system response regulator
MLIQALLVDDSRSALEYMKRQIEAAGDVGAITFTDPLEALAAARHTDIGLALVDYEMPHLDGISLIRELRALPHFSDIPIVMITSVDSDDVRLRALDAGATDFLPKQQKTLETQVRLRNLVKLGLAIRKLNDRAAHLAWEVAEATRQLQEREEEIILRLALSVEYRDNDTGDHTLRVAKYSRLIAGQLGLSPRLCRDIYLAAPLHDVGKVATPDHILLKPGGLSPDEIAVMRTHTTVGGTILAGYPHRLKGEEIPIAARIVAVADVFDALTTKRPYKDAFPLPVARQQLEEGKGRHFDPACVDAFIARWPDVVAIATGQSLPVADDAPALQPMITMEAPRMAAALR